ncbi:MAG: glycoside hydrolase family 97 protein [Phocaeicola sp.]
MLIEKLRKATFRSALYAVAAVGITACSPQPNHSFTSPNQELTLTLESLDNGFLAYNLIKGSDTLLAPSKIGLVLQGGDSICRDLVIESVTKSSFEEDWSRQWGENKTLHNHYNQALVSVIHQPTQRKYRINFRLFDDGVALRYEFPQEFSTDTLVVMDEVTEFNIAHNPQTWWSDADFNTYEKEFKNSPLDKVSGAATPMTMRKANGTHLFIHEAAIVKYPDMTLKNMGKGVMKCELTPWKNGVKAYVVAPFHTPWRMVVVSPDAKGLVASAMMLNLNEPSQLSEEEWIQPMTYMGIWWEMHLGSKEWKEGKMQAATTEEAKRYIDFAAANDIPAIVVEGWNTGWDKWGVEEAFDYVTSAKGYNLKEVANYAKEKGVWLIMHHETGADIHGYEALVDSAFTLCQELGIHAVKTGYAGPVSSGENHHGQQMVEHYQLIVEKAAQYQIMLDVHEPSKGSGLERTWPNLMTREGVRGMEWEAWSVGNSPRHTTTIPYTRGLSGPTDYTPGIIDILLEGKKGERKQWNDQLKDISLTRVHSTLCHQLALLVTIYSPLQMASDLPENYQGHPAFQFIKEYNADCDESVVVNGEIGEYITIARRAGANWFVGATTNEEARTMELSFDFLNEGKYLATIYQDGKDGDWLTNPTAYEIKEVAVNKNSTITIPMAAGGGFAITVKPVAQP